MAFRQIAKYKQAYQRYILEHAEAVSQVEEFLRSALVLVPGRFGDSELSTECVYTGISLISWYHDCIAVKNLLQRGIAHTPAGDSVPPPYCYNTARWLSAVQCVELLIEIFCTEKLGARSKWKAVFGIELLKAVLRFRLLFRTNCNILVHQDIPPRTSSALNYSVAAMKKIDKSIEQLAPGGDKKPRKTLLDYQNEQQQQLANKTFKTLLSTEPGPDTFMALSPPPPPPRALSRFVGESLYILRPLIYLISMYIYGMKSWRAWLLSLSTDLTSYYCLTNRTRLSPAESLEVRRRTFLWLYYFVRSPFFDTIAQGPVLSKSLSKLRTIKLLQRFFGPLFDYLAIYRERYFYTSAS